MKPNRMNTLEGSKGYCLNAMYQMARSGTDAIAYATSSFSFRDQALRTLSFRGIELVDAG
jgi:hypothetical protein